MKSSPMALSKLVRLLDRFDKINHGLRFYLCLSPIVAIELYTRSRPDHFIRYENKCTVKKDTRTQELYQYFISDKVFGFPVICAGSLSSNLGYCRNTDSTSGRRFCSLFELVLHHPEGNERTGDIRSSWVDVTMASGPILELFSRSRRDTENRGFVYPSPFSFTEVFQITSRLVSAKTKIGVKCTLTTTSFAKVGVLVNLENIY